MVKSYRVVFPGGIAQQVTNLMASQPTPHPPTHQALVSAY